MLLILAGCSPNQSGANSAKNGGAAGAAPERYMGVRPNVSGTWDGTSSSTTMLEQRIKQDSARGATSGGADTKY
jgi:hypothetical protein